MSAGTVAITADEAGRYVRFAISMQGLTIPEGSRTLWQIGNDIAGNRNRAVEQLVGDWIWFIDDDHAFRPDVLLRLIADLDSPEIDVVAANVLRRHQPFASVACRDDVTLDLRGHPADGVIEVEHTGSSGMLIRASVFERVEPPWFELGTGVSEDVMFCRKARAAGCRIWVDLGVPLGHITPAVVWPTYDEELGWVTGFSIADGFQIATDLAVEPA